MYIVILSNVKEMPFQKLKDFVNLFILCYLATSESSWKLQMFLEFPNFIKKNSSLWMKILAFHHLSRDKLTTFPPLNVSAMVLTSPPVPTSQFPAIRKRFSHSELSLQTSTKCSLKTLMLCFNVGKRLYTKNVCVLA